MNLFPTAPTLGTVIKGFRKTHGLSVTQLAGRWKLPLARMRSLENDVTLPTADELLQLSEGLALLPHQVERHVKQTAMRLLEEALHPEFLAGEAIAARHLPPAPAALDSAVLLAPPLRAAVAEVLRVDAKDDTAFDTAWRNLTGEPPSRQRTVLESAVSRLALEGEPLEEDLLP